MAVEPATMANGCLEVVAGSHLAPIPLGDNRCITPDWERAHEWDPVELQTGRCYIAPPKIMLG
mgnify:FL=1